MSQRRANTSSTRAANPGARSRDDHCDVDRTEAGHPRMHRKIALVASAIAGSAAAVALLHYWGRLRQTPALTEGSRLAGIRGRWVQAGPYRMFARTASPTDATATNTLAARPPVILVHGLVVSSRYMEPLALALARWFPVFAPDLPGFGESALRGRWLDLPGLANALHLWLVATGLRPAILVGNSFGCQILTELTARHPGDVRALVLQGPTADRGARHLPVQMWRALVNGRRERPHSPAAPARIDYAKAGLLRALATMRIMIRDRIENRLPLVRAPVLVVCGSRDPVSPREWAIEVTARLRAAQLIIIDGGTHTLNYVYPHSLALAIRQFVDTLPGEPSGRMEQP
ncbi:alpha/beta fold hydrolase [Paraburkholderia sp. EG304]|uniref:alpha/beta fold hydrolase n=1 Tax=Paraburkholderia sp. EG304 TaxID=3237015 RepID=UPI00397E4613